MFNEFKAASHLTVPPQFDTFDSPKHSIVYADRLKRIPGKYRFIAIGLLSQSGKVDVRSCTHPSEDHKRSERELWAKSEIYIHMYNVH